jgi:Ca2+-binding EF-hand superfamily protein
MARTYDAFCTIDADSDGRISLDEFVSGSAEAGLGFDDPVAVFNKIDANGGGSILFYELVSWLIAERIPVD